MEGDDDSFRGFVQARWASLVRYAYALTGDVGAAEDAVQTALEASWRRWPTIRTGRPEAYVRTAITRHVISRRRWLGRRPQERRITDEPPVRTAAGDGADSRALQALVWAELQALPPRMRAVVVLRVWEDLGESEVAALLGCSVGSVKSQLSRGLDRLRERAGLREVAGLGPPSGPPADPRPAAAAGPPSDPRTPTRPQRRPS